MSDNSSGNSGVGLGSMLLVLFIGLKLTDSIDWSWWWVMAPLWLPPIVILFMVTTYSLIKTAKGK